MTEIQLLECSANIHQSYRRSGKYELLGEAFTSKADVTATQKGTVIRYTILMMWKILHNVVPNCSYIKFTNTSRHGTRAIIPSLSRLSSLSNQTLYDSSFAVRGPKLWNKVPDSIKAEATFELFKVSLSKFLALIPDNPPISGYSCSWSNSLVDYSPTRWSDI